MQVLQKTQGIGQKSGSRRDDWTLCGALVRCGCSPIESTRMLVFLRRCFCLAVFAIHVVSAAQADKIGEAVSEGYGLDNPTLAYNLATPKDWGSAQPFLDLMRVARPWVGHSGHTWAAAKHDELVARNVFDADGWPLFVPDGLTAIGTIFAWKEDALSGVPETRRGVYELRYEGTGKIVLKGDADITSRASGVIRFINHRGGYIGLDITATDPLNVGDYIRNITLVREENIAVFNAGGLFSPAWLAHIKDARQIRFMDWMGANGSQVRAWSDMPRDTARGMGWIVSVEVMVRLANEIGTEPWFTIPHGATPAYNRAFATYVRDNLDPRLHVRVEYSNEVWNGTFAQHKAIKDAAQSAWGTPAVHDYYAKKSVETALIWEDVFGADGAARLINVISGQAMSRDQVARILSPAIWARQEPDTYVDPSTVFEEVAIASYFGGHVLRNQSARDEFGASVRTNPEAAKAWLTSRLLDADQPTSLPHVAQLWRDHANVVHAHGLRLVAYEGGQHIHFATSGRRDDDEVDAFLIDYMRGDDIARLYGMAWDAWAATADGPFMQFNAISMPAWSGSWGARAFVGDQTPRAQLLDDRNGRYRPWWTARACSCFLDGVARTGTDQADTLYGTDAEDILIGGRADDVFHPGKGADHIDGGDGIDDIVLAGRAQDYTILATKDGYKLDGPEGVKVVRGIERVRFAQSVIYLAE